MAIFDLTTEHGKMDYFSLYKINMPKGTQHQFLWFKHKQHQIAVQHYIPDNPEGSVFLVHGYYDHVGIYWPIIEFLLSKQIAIYCYDNIGHGLSTGERAHIDSFDEYQDLLNDLLVDFENNQDFPKPYTLIGQSMGGAICLEYLRRQLGLGIFVHSCLLAPLILPYKWNREKWLFYLVKYLTPWIKEIARKYSLRSHNEAFQKFTPIDPLQPKVLPVAWVNAMKNWSEAMRKTKDLHADFSSLTIVLAEIDSTVDNSVTISTLNTIFGIQSSHIINGAYHHLICEDQKQFKRLTDTLEQYV